jgi:hypothetical protein
VTRIKLTVNFITSWTGLFRPGSIREGGSPVDMPWSRYPNPHGPGIACPSQSESCFQVMLTRMNLSRALGHVMENFQETLETATLHPSPPRSVTDGVQLDAWVRRHVVYLAHGIVRSGSDWFSSAEPCKHLHTGRMPSRNLRHHV